MGFVKLLMDKKLDSIGVLLGFIGILLSMNDGINPCGKPKKTSPIGFSTAQYRESPQENGGLDMTIFLGCSSKFAAPQKISASGCQSQVRVAPDCTVKDVYLLMKVAETRSDDFFLHGRWCLLLLAP
jgi:hypothetical protein